MISFLYYIEAEKDPSFIRKEETDVRRNNTKRKSKQCQSKSIKGNMKKLNNR